jgi:hypothetical protein
MTELASAPATTPTITPSIATRKPTDVVTDFFDAYRRRDVEAMADLCTDNADFSYSPFEVWAKQRVMRGDGKVRTIGKVIWSGLIQHLEPEDLVAVTIEAAAMARVPLAGTSWIPGRER